MWHFPCDFLDRICCFAFCFFSFRDFLMIALNRFKIFWMDFRSFFGEYIFGYKNLFQIFFSKIIQGGLVIRLYFWLFIRPLFFSEGPKWLLIRPHFLFEVPKWLSIKPYFFLTAKAKWPLTPGTRKIRWRNDRYNIRRSKNCQVWKSPLRPLFVGLSLNMR